MKTFPRESFGSKPDYSGFDYESWVPRSGDQHKALARETLTAQTKTIKERMESASGVRYSEFFRLSYFDPIASHVVDPMHNLLLGTAKHVFATWIKQGLLDDEKIDRVDHCAQTVGRTKGTGRIARSMTHFKSLKAEEWKNWVLIYSSYCLKDVLPRIHYNIWQLFVRANMLLINTSITKTEAADAHLLLKLFCSKFQELYGAEACTPNMHMHLHLKSCIARFGPVYAFWAFSFERYNGLLGSYPTNNRSLTITIMRKFVDGVKIVTSYQRIDADNLPSLANMGLLEQGDPSLLMPLDKIRRKAQLAAADFMLGVHRFIAIPKLEALSVEDIEEVLHVLHQLLPASTCQVAKFVKSYQRVLICRDVICTEDYRGGTARDNYVFTRLNFTDITTRPASVCKILEITYTSNDVEMVMPFFQLKHFEEHQQKHWFGERCAMKLWSTMVDNTSFVPIHFYSKKATFIKAQQRFQILLDPRNRGSAIHGSDIVNFVI